MLIYEKRTYSNGKPVQTLYGTLDDVKSDSDLPLVFADTSGVELATRPTLSASYVSNLTTAGYDVLRTDDGQEMIVGIKTGSTITWVIGSVLTTANKAKAKSVEAATEEDAELPEGFTEGDILSFDVGNGTKQYRVLKLNEGMCVTVVAMDPIDSSAFEVESDSNIYNSSDLDDLLTKWHVTLSDKARAAIQVSYIYQYEYKFDTNAFNTDTHASYADPLEAAKKSGRLARYVFALDVDDIETYFNGKFSADDLKTFFWNDTANHDADTSFWLRTADTESSVSAYYVSGSGQILESHVGQSFAIRPAFKIDLDKISYSIV